MTEGSAGEPAAREPGTGEPAVPAPPPATTEVQWPPASVTRADEDADQQVAGPLAMPVLLLTTFIIATSGLVYELVAASMGSYLLGDSITQFSLVIGFYLSAMGLGSWLSKFLTGDLFVRFLRVEVAVGVVGGSSALGLLVAQAFVGSVRPLLLGLVIITGTLVGLEIPVLMRVLKDRVAFSELVARVLAFDYLGALAASLLFPLVLVPALGLARTALVFGLLNTGTALLLTWVFEDRLARRAVGVRVSASLATAFLLALLLGADRIALIAERAIYDAPVLLARSSPYQRLVLTRWRDDLRLWIDGHLQFSSKDEHRYHEALVHPAAAAVAGPLRRALVLGGGDGMALRELLRYPTLEEVTLVDLDPVMTGLFTNDPLLRPLNSDAFHDPRVKVVNADAMRWLEEQAEGSWDLIVIDFPDPRSFSLGKLYTVEFYRLVRRHLSVSGACVVQSTSPYMAPRAFWCIQQTIADAELVTHPYHAYVPSFGEWGYVLAFPGVPDPETGRVVAPRGPPTKLVAGLAGLRFLDDAALRALFVFPADMRAPADVRVNRLSDQILVKYHEDWLSAEQ